MHDDDDAVEDNGDDDDENDGGDNQLIFSSCTPFAVNTTVISSVSFFLSLSCSYHAQSLGMCTLGLAVVSIVLPCNPLSEPPFISTLVAAVVSNER